MAKHDGAAAEAEAVDGGDGDVDSIAVDIDAEDFDAADSEHAAGKAAKRRVPEWISRIPKPITVGVGTIAALLAVSGWLGFRLHQDHQVQDQRSLYVQVARQTAINLTTINYPGYEMGQVAARNLIDHLNGSSNIHSTNTIILRSELILRDSSVSRQLPRP